MNWSSKFEKTSNLVETFRVQMSQSLPKNGQPFPSPPPPPRPALTLSSPGGFNPKPAETYFHLVETPGEKKKKEHISSSDKFLLKPIMEKHILKQMDAWNPKAQMLEAPRIPAHHHVAGPVEQDDPAHGGRELGEGKFGRIGSVGSWGPQIRNPNERLPWKGTVSFFAGFPKPLEVPLRTDTPLGNHVLFCFFCGASCY